MLVTSRFGFEGRILVLIVLVPVNCLLMTFHTIVMDFINVFSLHFLVNLMLFYNGILHTPIEI